MLTASTRVGHEFAEWRGLEVRQWLLLKPTIAQLSVPSDFGFGTSCIRACSFALARRPESHAASRTQSKCPAECNVHAPERTARGSNCCLDVQHPAWPLAHPGKPVRSPETPTPPMLRNSTNQLYTYMRIVVPLFCKQFHNTGCTRSSK